ncbi:CAAX protease [Nitrosopumilus piranensis]|uniref:CAAX amino terminal protease family protein n=1 Tax=Nitrosopumilus piranensis TaxID=1582439 RepID=A0A0C5BQU8_9ARCH|nr:CAAX protease [Nitrosopumilus piranensis]AJM92113.1 CAAX amino terminal protease family protein [Nitrosopumilus piranensis]
MKVEISDFNPRTWLKPYKRNNILHLSMMALFYHALSMALMYTGSFLAKSTIAGYETPDFPVSVALALSAGLLEESVFFGIPYFMTGNPVILFGAGMVWSSLHLFSYGVYSVETLAYGGFLLSIPHIFFSIRTWISGKGWFAIAFHSGWNFSFLIIYCVLGIRQCSIINDTHDVLNVIMAVAVGMIVYLAFKNKTRQINRFYYLIPVAVILVSLAILYVTGSF